ncbi:hypothetical protein D3C85_1266270 [compost metagenome]
MFQHELTKRHVLRAIPLSVSILLPRGEEDEAVRHVRHNPLGREALCALALSTPLSLETASKLVDGHGKFRPQDTALAGIP